MDKRITPSNIGVAAAVAMSATALFAPGSGGPVVTGPAMADKAVVDIAKVSPEMSDKACSRERVVVRQASGPEMVWLCDGAYLPNEQAWLDRIAGPDGVRVVLTPQKTPGGLRYTATVTRAPAR